MLKYVDWLKEYMHWPETRHKVRWGHVHNKEKTGAQSKIVDAEITILRNGVRGQVQARLVSKAAIRPDGSVTFVCTLQDILKAFLEEEVTNRKGAKE